MDEVDRTDELTEPLGVRWVVVTPEISAEQGLGSLIDWTTEGQNDRRTPSTDVLRQHCRETRNLWDQSPAGHLSDGMLVRKLFDTDVAQMVVPHRLRRAFFDQSHSGFFWLPTLKPSEPSFS